MKRFPVASAWFGAFCLKSVLCSISIVLGACNASSGLAGSMSPVPHVSPSGVRVAVVVPESEGSGPDAMVAADVQRVVATIGGSFGERLDAGQVVGISAPYGTSATSREAFATAIVAAVESPDVKAVVVAPARFGTADAFRRIAEKRPDVVRIAVMPSEDPSAIQFASTLVIDVDAVAQAAAVVAGAKAWGLDAIVYLKADRGIVPERVIRGRAVMKAACAKADIVFTMIDGSKAAGGKTGVLESFVTRAVSDAIRERGRKIGVFASSDIIAVSLFAAAKDNGVAFLGSDDASISVILGPALEAASSVAASSDADRKKAGNALSDEVIKRAERAFVDMKILARTHSPAAALVPVALAYALQTVKNSTEALPGATSVGGKSADPLAIFIACGRDEKITYYIDTDIGVRAGNHLVVDVPLRPIGGASTVFDDSVPDSFYRVTE